MTTPTHVMYPTHEQRLQYLKRDYPAIMKALTAEPCSPAFFQAQVEQAFYEKMDAVRLSHENHCQRFVLVKPSGGQPEFPAWVTKTLVRFMDDLTVSVSYEGQMYMFVTNSQGQPEIQATGGAVEFSVNELVTIFKDREQLIDIYTKRHARKAKPEPKKPWYKRLVEELMDKAFKDAEKTVNELFQHTEDSKAKLKAKLERKFLLGHWVQHADSRSLNELYEIKRVGIEESGNELEVSLVGENMLGEMSAIKITATNSQVYCVHSPVGHYVSDAKHIHRRLQEQAAERDSRYRKERVSKVAQDLMIDALTDPNQAIRDYDTVAQACLRDAGKIVAALERAEKLDSISKAGK